ncbi:MAG: ABC transporter ATP-binding protein [bacterium]|nr:ABC transporter ATP-binding protein [bacterium]
MIEIDGVCKTIDNFSLEDVSLEIAEKEYMVILGPTGSGKTLLLETLAGIYQPDRGSIRMHGKDITATPPEDRNIGMVYQDYMLFPHLTLGENIAFGLKAAKNEKSFIKAKVEEAAEMLGISHLLHRLPAGLSGGERQRGALARAMVTEPRAMLLDEPFSAVDEYTAEKLQTEIKKLHRLTGATTIHITHRFDEAYVLADRIAVMKEGKIIQVDVPEVIFRRPVNLWLARFVGCKNLFPCKVVKESGFFCADVEGVGFQSVTGISGDAWLSIRPEDIYISRSEFRRAGLNSFEAVVKGIMDRGRLIEAELDAGIRLITVLSRQSAQKMELEPGCKVHITIRAEDVHLFKDAKGHSSL